MVRAIHIVVAAALALAPGVANAATFHFGCRDANEIIRCQRVTGANNDVVVVIESGDCTLSANALAALPAGVINDTVDFVRTSHSLLCDDNDGSGDDTLTEIAATSFTLTVDGDSGNDTMSGCGSSNLCTLDGSSGTDTINVYSSVGIGNGGADADTIRVYANGGVGNGGAGADDLYGEVAGALINGGDDNDDLLLKADGVAHGDGHTDIVCSNYEGGGEDLYGDAGDSDRIKQVNDGTAANRFDGGAGSDDLYVDPTPDPTNLAGLEGTISSGSVTCLSL